MFPPLKRFPEWKELYDHICPLIDAGKDSFTYAELTDMTGGLDVRNGRGRQHFYRMRKELLKDKQIWLENMWLEYASDRGYAIIPAKDHPMAAAKRVGYARRRVKMANAINANTRIEDLTPEQRIFQAATGAVLYELSKTFHAVGKHLAMARTDPSKLPVDLQSLINSINKPKRIKGSGKEEQ